MARPYRQQDIVPPITENIVSLCGLRVRNLLPKTDSFLPTLPNFLHQLPKEVNLVDRVLLHIIHERVR